MELYFMPSFCYRRRGPLSDSDNPRLLAWMTGEGLVNEDRI